MQSLMGTYFVYKYGSEALRTRYLTPALRGDLVATFALTEPNAGSDVAEHHDPRAERRRPLGAARNQDWVTNAPVADLLTVAAKTLGRARPQEHRAVPARSLDDARDHAWQADRQDRRARLGDRRNHLEDVEVPDEHLLGGETGGAEKVGTILAEIRIMTAALSVGWRARRTRPRWPTHASAARSASRSSSTRRSASSWPRC